MQAILLAAVVLLVMWFLYRRTLDVPATIDLEATERELHAHVVLEGVEVNEGDEVLVHNAPTHIPLNEVRTMSTRATVSQASLLRRAWERVMGRTRITELYEVGFEG
ncbi:MAG TPA: hypothetical protein VE861_12375 [Gemmatimonadaceae bacterium]|nr:hypothetical protein [Gemmatimonadaceae bacterium]